MNGVKTLFITFEGIEGSGKSSQIANVSEYFSQKGLKIIRTREPGGTPLAEKIRDLVIHKQEEELSPQAELLLFLAARAQHVSQVIAKNMGVADLILCDRFTDSTLAYQVSGRQKDIDQLRTLNAYATNNLVPDITFLMDLPVHDSQVRIQNRKKRNANSSNVDRFETETIEFHNRIRESYLAIAKQEPKRFVVLNALEKSQHILQIMIAEIEKRRQA